MLGSVLVMVGCASLAAGSAFAATVPETDIARLLACRSIAAGAARLQCFDRSSTILARAAGAPAAANFAVAATRPVAGEVKAGATEGRDAAALDPRRTFGLSPSAILAGEVKSGMRPREISSITARVTSLEPAPDGRMVYHLDDGQVWEELVANGYAPPVSRAEKVRISRGVLDSYWLQTASGRGCKVIRVR